MLSENHQIVIVVVKERPPGVYQKAAFLLSLLGHSLILGHIE